MSRLTSPPYSIVSRTENQIVGQSFSLRQGRARKHLPRALSLSPLQPLGRRPPRRRKRQEHFVFSFQPLRPRQRRAPRPWSPSKRRKHILRAQPVSLRQHRARRHNQRALPLRTRQRRAPRLHRPSQSNQRDTTSRPNDILILLTQSHVNVPQLRRNTSRPHLHHSTKHLRHQLGEPYRRFADPKLVEPLQIAGDRIPPYIEQQIGCAAELHRVDGGGVEGWVEEQEPYSLEGCQCNQACRCVREERQPTSVLVDLLNLVSHPLKVSATR